MASMHFRAGVVAVVVDSRSRVLAFERADVPGQWQLPQGGIDVDETPVDAAWRELHEETGLDSDDVDLIEEFDEWTVYQWPDHVRGRRQRFGQAQRWFRFRVRDDGVQPRPDGVEFVDWKWVDASWLVDQVVDFRKPAYQRVLLS
jgi:putative (di)nucleoside polyphosphate hydrolase